MLENKTHIEAVVILTVKQNKHWEERIAVHVKCIEPRTSEKQKPYINPLIYQAQKEDMCKNNRILKFKRPLKTQN